MSRDAFNAFTLALGDDEQLRQRFAAVQSVEEAVRLASSAGFDVTADDFAETEDLSDVELAAASGGIGLTFLPQTNWIFCDNPWTDWYCTFKC